MIQEMDLDSIRVKYDVPDEFKMTAPSPDDKVVFPSSWCITFYEDIFEAGIRFPLRPLISNL